MRVHPSRMSPLQRVPGDLKGCGAWLGHLRSRMCSLDLSSGFAHERRERSRQHMVLLLNILGVLAPW